MTDRFSAPWHKASFDRFIFDRLPVLLAERLPLAGYRTLPLDPYHFGIQVDLSTNGRIVSSEWSALPQPDEQGLFFLDEQPYIVLPLASQPELDMAEVRCVGEQLFEFIQARLGQAPADFAWDAALLRAFLPLDEWMHAFLRARAQLLDTMNWHSRNTHIRRLLVENRPPDAAHVILPGQRGRVDPFETPEGGNIGRVFTIALGAEISGGKIVITDPRPEAAIGHNAALVPFLEHNDPMRLLFAVNMMRQALPPPDPEPALVQTGCEPDPTHADAADLWCGRNLLTAFVAWGEATAEDGIIISQSAAARLGHPGPVSVGDKFANRHGVKGVISRILPDAEMPHLQDGTPVELVFSFTGLHRRLNFGQLREAVMGRIARAEGKPAIVPPFHAPAAEAIRARLARNGLPESGMERLREGQDGPEMPFPSTVGWVYWYKLWHRSGEKLRYDASGAEGQVMGELEITQLLDLGAFESAAEALGGRTPGSRPIDGAPTPMFARLVERLSAAGIRAALEDGQVRFEFDAPAGRVLRLARPLSHPWIADRLISEVGVISEIDGNESERGRDPAYLPWVRMDAPRRPLRAYQALVEANTRLASLLSGQAPGRLVEDASARLQTALSEYLDALLPPEALLFEEPQNFSGRAVIAPSVGLGLDQVGIPEAMARALFTPLAQAQAAGLDEVLSRSWMIVSRSPAISPTALLAFHPVSVDGPAVLLNPLVCTLLNADFDGDQVTVFVPVTEGGQREAGEKLSVAAHVRRDHALVESLIPPHEGIWGLAWLSLTDTGRAQLPTGLQNMPAPLTQNDLARFLHETLEREGLEPALETAMQIAQLGYAACSASGASLSPFAGSALRLPPQPSTDDPNAWAAYTETAAEQILSGRDFSNPDLGPQLLSAGVRSGGRAQLAMLVGPRGVVIDESGLPVVIRHSYVDGLTPEELFASVAGSRRGLAQLAFHSEKILDLSVSRGAPARYSVLARARRSRRPGVVFARAAAAAEIDPLADAESRLLVGIK